MRDQQIGGDVVREFCRKDDLVQAGIDENPGQIDAQDQGQGGMGQKTDHGRNHGWIPSRISASASSTI